MTTREQAQTQLTAWIAGNLSAQAVWEWALACREAPDWPPEDGLLRDVVDVLAALPVDLILEEDAEVMAYALGNPVSEADLGQNLLWNHLDAIDADGRRRDLREHPFYGPYCSDIV